MAKKIVHYSNLTVEGFQSIGGALSFNLDRGGLNLIKGTNGVGKSTIFNALLWVEYGINLKKSVSTWEDRRPSTYRGTRVTVTRTDGVFDYLIARHLDFKGQTKGLAGGSKLMIFKKSVDEPKFEQHHLQGDGQHKADMQLMIDEQIGVDGQTYLNSILFGQRMKSLAEVDNKDKRSLFDKLFDVAFVEEAKVRAKERKDVLVAEGSVLNAKINEACNSVSNLQNFVASLRTSLDAFETAKKSRLSELQADLLDESKNVSFLESEIAKAEAILATFVENEDDVRVAAMYPPTYDKYVSIKAELASLINTRDNRAGKLQHLETKVLNLREEAATNDFNVLELSKVVSKLETDKRAKNEVLSEHETIMTLELNVDAAKQRLLTEKDVAKDLERDFKSASAEASKSLEKLAELEISLINVSTVCPTCKGDLNKESVEKVKTSIRTQISREKEVALHLPNPANIKEKLEKQNIFILSCEENYNEAVKELNVCKVLIKELDSIEKDLALAVGAYNAQKAALEHITSSLNNALEDLKEFESQNAEPTILEKTALSDALNKELEACVAAQTRLDDIRKNKAAVAEQLGGFAQSLEISLTAKFRLNADIKRESELVCTVEDPSKYELQLKETQAFIEEETPKLSKITEEALLVDWWLTKGFGSSGLKSFVFNAMLAGLNTYAQHYANRLGFRVEFSIDMTKASKPFQMLIYDGDKVRDYEDLSGGQKQRVDVCLAFAMHDLVSVKVDINVVLLDEIFEGLDNAGIEAAMELIRTKAETKSVYVISHSDLIDGLSCRNIWVSADRLGNTVIE